ncbi:NAD(P)H-binding protein [Anaeromyxobacter dehalogenans]|nr:NAD(P)H-binding protein [Anaeromyxobacter dehalogenans]
MFIALGATGRVGSAVAIALLDGGEQVTVVTRDPRRAEPFARRSAAVAVADVRDADALRAVLRRGRRAFLLMPPADPAGDTVVEERRAMQAIARAVDGAGLEKVVVLSTYGAQPGEALGDLGVLHALEQAVAGTGVPTCVVRGAYFMSNWDFALELARGEGVVPSLFPPDLALPMVAPADLGRAAARWLVAEGEHAGVHHVEGPAAYSAADVARAASAALGRDVRVVETPRARWVETFRALGFSPSSADSYARMTATVVDGAYERPEAPERGPTTLAEYVARRVRRGA